MAYEDSSPERRNLMVTSLAFIAFTFAGGEFQENTVQLEVINATFTKPFVLVVMAWVMLFWFIYRYWQAHGGEFAEKFKMEFQESANKKYLRNYLSMKINKKTIEEKEEGYHINQIWWEKCAIRIEFIYAMSVSRNKYGVITANGMIIEHRQTITITLQGFKDCAIGLLATIECMVKKPSFSSYIVPYVFAILAIAGGVFRCVL